MPLFISQESGIGKYRRITTAGTVALKTSPGSVLRVIVNSSTSSTLTIYDTDSTSDLTNHVVAFGASLPVGSYAIGAVCRRGIVVVTSASCDFTIIYQ